MCIRDSVALFACAKTPVRLFKVQEIVVIEQTHLLDELSFDQKRVPTNIVDCLAPLTTRTQMTILRVSKLSNVQVYLSASRPNLGGIVIVQDLRPAHSDSRIALCDIDERSY